MTTKACPRGPRPSSPIELARERTPKERPQHHDIDVRLYEGGRFLLAHYDAERDAVDVVQCCDRCGLEEIPWDEIHAWRYEFVDDRTKSWYTEDL